MVTCSLSRRVTIFCDRYEQLIALLLLFDSYVAQIGGLTNDDLSKLFSEWNQGELDSFLIEITATILKKRDESGEGFQLDKVLDKIGMKGTGTWTVQEAAARTTAAPTIAAAVDARFVFGPSFLTPVAFF